MSTPEERYENTCARLAAAAERPPLRERLAIAARTRYCAGCGFAHRDGETCAEALREIGVTAAAE